MTSQSSKKRTLIIPSEDLQQVNLVSLDLFFFFWRGRGSKGRRVEFGGKGNSKWKCCIDFCIQLLFAVLHLIKNIFYFGQVLMAETISEDHLMGLVKGRKFKEYAPYVKEIEKFNSEAEDGVRNVLENVLVRRTERNPGTMFNALMLYKQLIVGASVDYFTNDDLFPNTIHEEVAKICTYRPNIEYFSNRGGDYFVDLFKIQKTESNKVEVEKVGNSYVLLALELVQAMAKWYPQEYDNKDKKSLFKKRYDELLAKKITFPKENTYMIVKPVDQENFKANYQRFLKRVKEEEEEAKLEEQRKKKEEEKKKEEKKKKMEEEVKKQVKKQEAKKEQPKKKEIVQKASEPQNTLNVEPAKPFSIPPKQEKDEEEKELLLLKQDLVSAVIAPPKKDPPKKKEEAQPSAIVVAKKQPPKEQAKPVEPPKSSLLPKPREEALQNKEQSMIRTQNIFTTNHEQESNKIGNTLKSGSDKAMDQLNTNSINSYKKGSQNQASGFFGKIEEQLPGNMSSQEFSRKKGKPQINQLKLKKPDSKLQPAKPNFLNSGFSSNIQDSKQQSKKYDSDSIPQPYSFTQQQPSKFPSKEQPKQPVPQDSKPQPKDRERTPIKIKKTQRFPDKSQQNSPQNTFNKPQNGRSHDLVAKRPRSLPKTEKRGGVTNLNFYPRKIQGDFLVHMESPGTKQIFNKTLSYWATKRIKHNPSRELEKSTSLGALLEEMRLDRRVLPFISKYYEPVTTSMHSLRQESLNLYNSGQPSCQFLSTRAFQCRLLKEGNSIFTLSIQNVSSAPLLVEYLQMKGIKYCNRIKIVRWGNRSDITPFELPRKGFMDIKFRFRTADLNFKFLPFHLQVDKKVETILLPITLLDMADITPIGHGQLSRYSLTGSIICSESFPLKGSLPLFLGGFRFPLMEMSRSKREIQRIVGQCSVRMQNEESEEWNESRVQVVVKVVSWEKQTVELNVLYISKSQESEDLAKVTLYLLLFLLKND